MSKKTYDARRNLVRICTKCNGLWISCNCSLDQSDLIFVNDTELTEYFNSGLVPDVGAELWCASGCPLPPKIKRGEDTHKMEYLEVLREHSAKEEIKRASSKKSK